MVVWGKARGPEDPRNRRRVVGDRVKHRQEAGQRPRRVPSTELPAVPEDRSGRARWSSRALWAHFLGLQPDLDGRSRGSKCWHQTIRPRSEEVHTPGPLSAITVAKGLIASS